MQTNYIFSVVFMSWVSLIDISTFLHFFFNVSYLKKLKTFVKAKTRMLAFQITYWNFKAFASEMLLARTIS